jgi:hypothetical protein
MVARRTGITRPEIGLVTVERPHARQRATSPDRFALAADSTARGRHVLLIEDTWTSRGNAQSAALTLRDAAAASVTIALARWLNPDEQPTGEFLSSRLTED